ncbi:LacI family DNA-binding transcriptional regulator [Lactiplantibacillus mudanjiangensis]|uniref:HTH lacI-type domain-containing protein n=1 Tax=Lactiplantibacillus mudanjiangensis TaxID=1296538 RepID=A0A660E295_9LACO|nr:LacI family DNA-binding transcriptional regulator [Lactiplantibacillus mudanjiangensis]VDG22569.1 hypothetical protein [Lactobacillus sp. CBA3605] [Lactiplantibacillus mudanjiangensis]VDG26895.1 hypothetical protein [Lactobacillus sp. CBA3605] [Lactiplantibacillus mudanjiangensis]
MSKTVNITDIARLANVSVATVSNALKGKKNVSAATRERIIKIAASNHYQPSMAAQGLRTQHTKLIGMLVHDFQNVFSSTIAEDINRELHQRGYSLVVIANNSKRLLNASLFDGLIVFNYPASKQQLETIITASKLPTVLMASDSQLPNVVNVVTDNRSSVIQLSQLYEQTDHKKVCFFTNDADSYNSNSRWQTYHDYFLNKHQYDITSDTYNAHFRSEPARELALKLLQAQKYNFFYCLNDMMAYGVYQAAEELNLTIGQDISVVGFDNTQSHLAIFQPKLTTADPNMPLWSKMISDQLIDRIENQALMSNRTEYVPNQVISGSSVHLID